MESLAAILLGPFVTHVQTSEVFFFAPRCLLLMLVNMPLRIVNRCCSGFAVCGGI